MIIIAASNKDTAGTNIAKQILTHYPFTKTNKTFQENPIYQAEINNKQVQLITLREEAVYAQTLPKQFPNLNLIIFISKHSSKSGTPTLTVHTTGNFTKAELGGLPNQVSTAPAKAMQTALKALKYNQQKMQLNYTVSYECTHHGPTLNVPTMFTELGSTPKQWNDQEAAEAVAHATIAAITENNTPTTTVALGIGGTHYNQHFTQMALTDEAAFSHMIPKHAVQHINAKLLIQCIERTLEKVNMVILDWKGIRSADKPKLLATLNELKFAYKKV